MNELVKEVNFQGQQILSILEENKIYVSVKSICDNLGMSKNQTDTQVRKIQNDELLRTASKLSPLQTITGNKETLIIELDYLPIWLAKINPARFNDELKSKLIIYQLKAKDVLAETFLGKRESANKISNDFNDWALKRIYDRTKQAEWIEDKIMELREKLNLIYKDIEETVALKRELSFKNFDEFKRKSKYNVAKEKLPEVIIPKDN